MLLLLCLLLLAAAAGAAGAAAAAAAAAAMTGDLTGETDEATTTGTATLSLELAVRTLLTTGERSLSTNAAAVVPVPGIVIVPSTTPIMLVIQLSPLSLMTLMTLQKLSLLLVPLILLSSA